jgi:hypothetical protein
MLKHAANSEVCVGMNSASGTWRAIIATGTRLMACPSYDGSATASFMVSSSGKFVVILSPVGVLFLDPNSNFGVSRLHKP